MSANAKPVAEPGEDYVGAKGVPVQFDGTASFDPNQKAITYAWNFGDPTSASNTSTVSKPTHTYMRAGDYTVTLTVTDAAGLKGTSTTTASIPNIVPAVTALPGASAANTNPLIEGVAYESTAGRQPERHMHRPAMNAAIRFGSDVIQPPCFSKSTRMR